jgi:hypothetical protein
MIQEFENEVPCHIRKAIFALRIRRNIRAILAQGEIGMHAGTIDPNEWLRKAWPCAPWIEPWRQISLYSWTLSAARTTSA